MAKPAYWRIVQNRDRYIVAWTPRVNGYSPGSPRSVAGSRPATLAGVYTSATGISDVVANSSRRSREAATALARVVSRQRASDATSSGVVPCPFASSSTRTSVS